jgi:hypothetical protein
MKLSAQFPVPLILAALTGFFLNTSAPATRPIHAPPVQQRKLDAGPSGPTVHALFGRFPAASPARVAIKVSAFLSFGHSAPQTGLRPRVAAILSVLTQLSLPEIAKVPRKMRLWHIASITQLY